MTEVSNTAIATGPDNLAFRKMHGLGNDFVLLDLRRPGPGIPEPEFVRALADRHTGIGFDQLIGILPDEDNVGVMLRFWNADGTEAGACGNGTRCAADLLMRERDTAVISLRTSAGVLRAERVITPGQTTEIAVDLGRPRLDWREIPLSRPTETRAFEAPRGAAALTSRASAVNMGNPHCVLFVQDASRVPVRDAGPVIETDPLFPEGTNVSFAEIIAPDRIRLRVWERGAGETRACGSAACATLVAAVRLGRAERSARIDLDGGTLRVEWPEAATGVRLQGPVASVFQGVVDRDFADCESPGVDLR